ncbi:MAG: outer membrane protein transport protein [Ghiorsea sp.]
MNTFKLIKNVVMFTAASFLLTAQAFASGFMIPEQGAKAMGMGNAFSSVANDASANWFNPAGLAFQENNATVSSVVVYPLNDFEAGGTTYSATKAAHVIPQAYLRYGADDSDLSFGLGVNSPFGLSVDWSDSKAPFSLLSAGSDSVTFSEIQAIHVNPNVAYKISDNFSIAVGLSYYNAFKVHLDNHSVTIGGSGDGFGGNLALLYKSDSFSAGLSYRSSVKVDITGTAVGRDGVALLTVGGVSLNGIGANANTSVTFPDIITASLSFRPTDDLLVSLQADRVNWSTFDQIVVNYDASALNLATGKSSTIPEGWVATTAIRLGAELALSKSSKLRAGYVNDPTPTNPTDFSPRLPGNDRQLVTLGYGSELSDDLTLDLAYAYVWLTDRTATAPTKTAYYGTFKSVVHILAAGVTYNF